LQTISIGTIKYAETFREKLASHFAATVEKGSRVEVSENGTGQYCFFHFNIVNKSTHTLIYYIADLIAEVVIDQLETSLIKKFIHEQYNYFVEEEKENILQKAAQTLHGGMIIKGKPILSTLERKKEVFQKALDYLEKNESLIIEGFLRFRLKDYYSQLEEAVSLAVENFIVEREYKEFLRLLKYFVEMQEPRIEEIHVIWLTGKNFQIVDAQGKRINSELLEEFALDIRNEGIDQGDLLVSTLISISPSHIILHAREQKEVIETVKSIFNSRVTVCLGCPLCGLKDFASQEERQELVLSTINFSSGKEKS